MRFCFFYWTTLALAGGMLAAGCGNPRWRPVDASSKSKLPPPPQTSDQAPIDQSKVEAHARYAAGVVDAAGENPALAMDEFFQAATNDPGNEPLVLEVTRDFLQTGQADRALKILDLATAQPSASGELFARLGETCFQLGRTDRATSASLMAIKKSPGLIGGYQTLFQIYLRNKQLSAAMDILDKAARVSRAGPDFLLTLGELYSRVAVQLPGQSKTAFDRALEIYQRAARIDFKETDLRLRLADGFSVLGKFDQAAQIYLGLSRELADSPFLRETVEKKLVEISAQIKDRKLLGELLETLINENPTEPSAYFLLGALAYDETNYNKAAECFTRVILLNPEFEPAYENLAGAQIEMDKTAEAKMTLENGLKKFPRSFDLENLSGIVDSRLKDYTNAVRHFTTAEVIAQATNPKKLTDYFYFQFGSACERLGDIAQAEKYFLKCLSLSPSFDEAQNYLGYMWAEHGMNLERAHELITKAVTTDPKNPAYLDSMAWVLFKLNQPRDALAFELKAVANSKDDDAEIDGHLGDIYSALGETAKAREFWKKSLALEPNDEIKRKLDSTGR